MGTDQTGRPLTATVERTVFKDKKPMAHVKRKCKTRIEIVGARSPRPQSVRVGGPNPYEDSVAVARFLNMNQTEAHVKRKCKMRIEIVGAGSPRRRDEVPLTNGLGNSTLTKNRFLLHAFLTSARKFYALFFCCAMTFAVSRATIISSSAGTTRIFARLSTTEISPSPV